MRLKIFAVLAAIALFALFLAFFKKQQFQLPGIKIPAQERVALACPSDYCKEIARTPGRCPEWTGKTNETYRVEECYDYPDYATSLKECEEKKVNYTLVCGVRV